MYMVYRVEKMDSEWNAVTTQAPPVGGKFSKGEIDKADAVEIWVSEQRDEDYSSSATYRLVNGKDILSTVSFPLEA
jgi:hypothetical protein